MKYPASLPWMLRLLLALSALCAARVFADDAGEALERTREQLAEDNPAELWQARGEAEWQKPAGPRQVSLAQCDLGLGPGVVKGSFAQLPRWFADSGAVMDLEQRLVWCMVTLQGQTREQAEADHFGAGARQSRLEALAAWIAGSSRGLPVHVPASRPEEQRLLALGQQMFYYRAGRYDFACASCHSGRQQRVRLQSVPDLSSPEGARQAWPSWPAYRISQGELRTMQYRIQDCLRQQRMPEARYGSELVTALSLFLAHQAEGAVVTAPALKR